ncbi:hypothetical protein BaRGS_00022193 [Batillaria attramentaria]|uniref:UspA domain-containing protein n=1 Tax=Batillaria attramentaria TaxID=370345 RepID=A0ABD0KHL4_9CAEN
MAQSVVLICVDPSKHSDYALDYYLKHVHKEGNVVEVVHVPEFWDCYGPMEGPTPGRLQELRQETAQATAALRDKVTNILTAAGVQAKFEALQGKEPWETILDFARKVNATLIVIGSRGMGKVRRTFLGSVSDSVLHHADCPVLICRHPQVQGQH